ncbi:MAG: amidohydrolase family protein [Steroidobacteraceae bacterium]
MRAILMSLALAGALIATSIAKAATLIHAGRVLAMKDDRVRERQTIVIEDGRIVSVSDGLRPAGPGDQLIDLSGMTVLPGLADMHVHITSEYRKSSELDQFKLNGTDVAIDGVVNAKRTLLAGFTLVRDLGDTFLASLALRDAINAGKVEGPRIFAAGKAIATTGGHADPTNGWAGHLQGDPGPRDGVVNGLAEAAAAVRQRYKDGSDVIKITATGGVLSVARNGQNPQFSEEEIRAIVTTARDYGFTVAAHAHGAEGIKRAVRAGVDSIEHGTFMDEEGRRLMKERGTYYVPTITAGWWVYDRAQDEGFFPALVRPKALAIGPQIQGTFAKAYKSGVKIMFGTDTGVSAHGGNAREFKFMVDGGMPPIEAIRSSTVVPAVFLGVDKDLGTIEPGKFADLIAVAGNPLDDITLLERVRFVMKAGQVYKSP